MGSYLFFQSSGFLFPRLTNQNSLIRLLHATGPHVFFNDAHQSTSTLKVGSMVPDGLRPRAERQKIRR
jgi:hypothetical protein